MTNSKKQISAFEKLILAGILCLPLCLYLGESHWLLDLVNHFLTFTIAFAAVAAFWCVYRRFWVHAFLCATVTVFLAGPLIPYLKPAPPASVQTPDLKIFYANVYTINKKHTPVIENIRKKNPDFFVLLETNDRWLAAISKAFPEYPYKISEPREDNFGISMFSKIPMTFTILHTGSWNAPFIKAEFKVKNREIVLWAAHTHPPKSASRAAERDAHLKLLGENLRQDSRPSLLTGDLNTSPWSKSFDFVMTERMQDSRKGFGLGLSWPSVFPPFMRTPIDFILHSPEFEVLKFELLKPGGSDHSPLYAELAFKN